MELLHALGTCDLTVAPSSFLQNFRKKQKLNCKSLPYARALLIWFSLQTIFFFSTPEQSSKATKNDYIKAELIWKMISIIKMMNISFILFSFSVKIFKNLLSEKFPIKIESVFEVEFFWGFSAFRNFFGTVNLINAEKFIIHSNAIGCFIRCFPQRSQSQVLWKPHVLVMLSNYQFPKQTNSVLKIESVVLLG